MGTYQIPKLQIEVKLALTEGPVEPGIVFLTESYRGEATLESFLNHEEEQFFPFRKEEGQVRLINKKSVVYLVSDEKEPEQKELLSPPIEIEVFFAHEQSVKGKIYSSLPQDTLRVSDFINQNDSFLAVFTEEGKFILNKDRILYVLD